jgi:hypothetical protein
MKTLTKLTLAINNVISRKRILATIVLLAVTLITASAQDYTIRPNRGFQGGYDTYNSYGQQVLTTRPNRGFEGGWNVYNPYGQEIQTFRPNRGFQGGWNVHTMPGY